MSGRARLVAIATAWLIVTTMRGAVPASAQFKEPPLEDHPLAYACVAHAAPHCEVPVTPWCEKHKFALSPDLAVYCYQHEKAEAELSGAISDYARRCFPPDPTKGVRITLAVTTDSDGVVRRAVVAPVDVARVNADPALRQYAERAVRAIMDPNCSRLPLPQTLLGRQLEFTFRVGG
jgi:hypothetical protein